MESAFPFPYQLVSVALIAMAAIVALLLSHFRARNLKEQLAKYVSLSESLSVDVELEDDADSERFHILISYVDADLTYAESLKMHLDPILHKHDVGTWEISQTMAFGDYVRTVKKAVKNSQLIIVLVSPQYLASEHVKKIELPQIISAAKSGVSIRWVPIRPSAVERTSLSEFKAAISPGRPLALMDDRQQDITLVSIAENVDKIFQRALYDDGDRENVKSSRVPDVWRLSKIRLRNIRCFEEIEIDFEMSRDQIAQKGRVDIFPSLRTVLVGDNATGKSTLLRSIAIGLCDESRASALLQQMPGRMIRSGCQEAEIELTMRRSNPIEYAKIRTEISQVAYTGGVNEVVRKSGDDPAPQLVVGYGTQRTRSGTSSHDEYDIGIAVSTLFDSDATLQNPELVLLRQPRWVRKDIQEMIAGILDLESDNFEFGDEAIRVTGPWGREKLEVLSDGYRSTSQWILDFVNWLIYFGENKRPEEVAAIVLIDELEQHLHPQWQRNIISRLRERLPNIQFVITTHSPLVASSITQLDDDNWTEKLIYFNRDDDGLISATESTSLGGMSVEQVLASPAFDYLIDAEPSVAAVYEEASRLASKGSKRSAQEEARYEKAKSIVGEMLLKKDATLIEQEARSDLMVQTQSEIEELESVIFGDKK